MATSGSTNYTIDRDTLITHVYDSVLGAITAGGTVDTDELAAATTSLQMMLKAWQASGLQLWAIKKAILIPEKGKQSYDLGLTGDHCSLTMYKTEMRVAGAATDTTMEVDSTTNMTALDNVGVVQDDGTIHWTTVASVTDSDTFELTTGLVSASAIDNHIYWYTNKIDRPHHVLEAYRREWDTAVDVPMTIISRAEFDTLSDKDQEGTPVNCYYDPQLTNSVLNVWNTADSNFASNNVFVLRLRKPFDDMDASTDDFEFPQEWYEAIALGLGKRRAQSVGMPPQDRQRLDVDASIAYELALDWSAEDASVYLQPE